MGITFWRRWTGLALAGVTLAMGAGCGYHLVGTSSYLPANLKTLYVATFTNHTKWTDMDQRLTEAVTREWVRRRRFTIVSSPKGADLKLEGTIKGVGISPVRFDQQGRATEYQMTLVASVKLIDQTGKKPKVLWEDKSFSRRTSYQVDVSAVDYFDRQLEAIDRVSGEFARSLVSAVLEGF